MLKLTALLQGINTNNSMGNGDVGVISMGRLRPMLEAVFRSCNLMSGNSVCVFDGSAALTSKGSGGKTQAV